MATSKFYVTYTDGIPELSFEELIYNDDEGNIHGGWSALEDIPPDATRVLMLIDSSTAKLTEMKSDVRYEWVEDVDGWTPEEGGGDV